MTVHFIMQRFEDKMHNKYYSSVVISAEDFEIFRDYDDFLAN